MTQVRIVRLYDGLDDDGQPMFDGSRPHLGGDDPRRDALLRYLDDGVPLMQTTATMLDVVDPGRGEAVPLSFVTDGRWIWTEGVAYYLDVHGVAPDPELVAHIEAAGYVMPPVSAEDVRRALAELEKPMAG